MISKLVLVFWWCSPGASIAGDCLAASAPACCYTTCRNPSTFSSLLGLCLDFSFWQYVKAPSLVLWPVLSRGRAKLPLPKSRPLELGEPRGQGVNSTRPGPGGPFHWEKNVARVTRPMHWRGGWGCENYSLYYLMLLNPASSLPLLWAH